MVDATVPVARKDPTLRNYVLRRLRLQLGGSVVGLVVPDSREWLRHGSGLSEPGPRIHSERWEPPYWQRVWPAAFGMAQCLSRVDLAGRRVLDLGCGLGVPGIVAARKGAAVTFVDREPDALAFALWNARACRADAKVESRVLDWSDSVVEGQFDLVLLADVTYRTRHHEPLRRQLQECVAPGGLVLHAEPLRAESEPFLEWLRATHAMTEATRDVHVDGTAVRVRSCAALRDRCVVGDWAPLLDAMQRSARGSRAG